MLSRPIFWQAVRSNYALWVACTAVLTVMVTLIAAFHDPSALSSFMELVEDTRLAEEAGEQLDKMGTLLGILAQTVFGFSGIMIAMVYVVVAANGLVASEVDRGSMAYTLSTPVKRTTVVFTKALYLVISIVLMFVIIGGAGAVTVQLKHHAIWGTNYTDDVKAASRVLGLDEAEVAGNLSLIRDNPEALTAGAEARNLDVEVYSAYLAQAMQRDAYLAAAEVLGVETSELEKDPSLIQRDPAALAAAAAVMGMDADAYSRYLDQVIAQSEASAGQQAAMEEALKEALTAAGEFLGMTRTELAADPSVLKGNSAAMAIASEASGLDLLTLDYALTQAMAANELAEDVPVGFNAFDYLMMNLGFLLLMLAISSIAFLASCVFNLSKFSLAFGGGLPFAFLILNLLSTVNDTLEPLKYFSLVTLFDTEAIMERGTYLPQFAVLGVIAVVLYIVAIAIFKRRDLPL